MPINRHGAHRTIWSPDRWTMCDTSGHILCNHSSSFSKPKAYLAIISDRLNMILWQLLNTCECTAAWGWLWGFVDCCIYCSALQLFFLVVETKFKCHFKLKKQTKQQTSNIIISPSYLSISVCFFEFVEALHDAGIHCS